MTRPPRVTTLNVHMKRSEINKAIKQLEELCAEYSFALPPFCHFKVEDWHNKTKEYQEVIDCGLGWDITDFGLGDFKRYGLSLITIRNGNRLMAEKYPKVYAEKIMCLMEGQECINHFHWHKSEDIINRGGGNLAIKVYNSLPNEEIDYESKVKIISDGRTCFVNAGARVILKPGESIHIYQGLYHSFTPQKGTGIVLIGEVSECNDDKNDNRFNPPTGRFPKIEEDEKPYRLLCTEYPKLK